MEQKTLLNILDVQPNFWVYWFAFCGIIMGRYFITAGGTHWLLHLILGEQLLDTWFGNRQQEQKAISEDIKLSTLSAIFFALSAACFMSCYQLGVTRVYTQLRVQDLTYLVTSYLGVLILQDTYFYFMHRLFHLPMLFKRFHQGHHRSRIPTPWTSFAFDPLEAAIQAFFLFCITLIIPLHYDVLLALLTTMTIWAVGNHLGFQIIPDSRLSRWWGRWCIGSTHHLVHHNRYSRHYGLYFTFWDKLLGTQDINYEAKRS